jgi:hypothetical protein
MRIVELLLEYDVNKIRQMDSLLASRQSDNSLPQSNSVTDLADILEKQMNIKSGDIIYWILSRYLKSQPTGSYGIMKWEDIHSRLIPSLEKYTKLKNKKLLPVEQRDINQIKSLEELEDLLDQYPEEHLTSKKEKRNEIEQGFYDRKEATLVYNDAQIKVVIPLTKSASCYFGTHTRWCTAAKQNYAFADYNKKGRLYILLIKPLNQRYQFHWSKDGRDSFMDELDKPINPHELATKYPVLWDIFTPIAEQKKSVVLNKNPNKKTQITSVSKNGKNLKYINNPSEDIIMAAFQEDPEAIAYIKNPSESLKLQAVMRKGQAIRYIKNPSDLIKMEAVKQNGYALQFIKNPSEEIKMEAVKQTGRAIQLIKNPSVSLQIEAIKQYLPALKDIKNPSEEAQLFAIKINPLAIQFIKKPSKIVKDTAVKEDPNVLSRMQLAESVDSYNNWIRYTPDSMIDNQKGWGAVPDNQNVDYLGMRVLMGAGTFLSLASPLSRQTASSADDIRRHLESGGTVGSPWLTIRIPPEWSDGDFSTPARVISHEGRNRMWAIQELVGNQGVEVHVFFEGGLRARHIQPEWIRQINQQLIPQGGTRPIEGAFFDTLIKEGAPGTLKAKITRTYGGTVTCDKARRLKSRSGATTHDKRQANWFLNMNCGGASRLDEIFAEPAQHKSWQKYGMAEGDMYVTRFKFDDKQVIIELVSLTGAQSQRVFDFVHMDQAVSPQAQGYELIFRVDTHTSITGELGTRAGKLLAQVVSVIRGFLESHDWDFLIFSAEGESRLNLYEALARRIAHQHHMSYAHRMGHFVIYNPDTLSEDAAGVGLVVPGVNMPAGQHADEIRRQARKWGFRVSAQGVPPTARTDGKLTEGKQTPCIVVDVQPAYSGILDGDENPVFEHIIQFVNQQTGPVLMFVNAEDQGLTGDTVQDVKSYWEDSGFDPDNWHRVTIVDKGYGALRSWIDQGIPARAIIKTIRTMYAQKVSDSRQLFGGEDSDSYEPGFKQLLGSDYDPIMLDDPIYVNWISVAQLKRFEGSFMMGGGRHECLREVELIMNAFNIHFKRVNDLVYG